MKKVFIIAEAGVNHNGSLSLAKKMIDAAAAAGADAIKFQTFIAEEVTSASAPKAAYQKKNTGESGSQRAMLKALELDRTAHTALMAHCKKRKIMFLSTPFDLQSIRLLEQLGIPMFKIPSGELTNLPYLRAISCLRKKIILSTGMADLTEIQAALDVLVRGGTDLKHITLLHCTTEYPAPFAEVNLRAMTTLRDTFRTEVGYSDHTKGLTVSLAAAALGATVIEKHFTLDKNMPGPDHKASIDPSELKELVSAVRIIETALGSAVKRPTPSERANRLVARKSIVARTAIKKDELFTTENIAIKRPGTGISPMRWDSVLGKKAKKSFRPDELIRI